VYINAVHIEGTPANWGRRIRGSIISKNKQRTWRKLQLGKEGGHTTVEGHHQCQARPTSHTRDIEEEQAKWGREGSREEPTRAAQEFRGLRPSSSFTNRLQGCCKQYRSDGSTLQARGGKKAKMESFEYSFGDRFAVVLRSVCVRSGELEARG